MHRNLVEMEIGTVVLVIFIILSSVFMILRWEWKNIAVDLFAFTFNLLDSSHSVIFGNS